MGFPDDPKVAGKSDLEEGRFRDEYSSNTFYIRSIDSHGNRDTIRLEFSKFPPFLSAKANSWVADERTPYRSIGDLVRDAVAHRVHQLEEMDEKDLFEWSPYLLAARRERLAAEVADMREQTTAFRHDIAEAIQTGDMPWLHALIEMGQEAIQAFRDPYRSELERIIQPYLDGTITLHPNSGT